ncbi:MAG: hypothetical protein AAF634_12045 [Bacteroidota bacterium]
MKSFAKLLIALFALGAISCTHEDSVENEEALFTTNELTLETKADTGNTGAAEDPPPDK